MTRIILVWIAAMVAVGGLFAQEPARNLQDLVGAKGGDGEYQMQERGYHHVRTDKSGSDAYSYWKNRHGNCITVRTSNGRYQSIVHTPDFDCRGGGGHAASGQAHERKEQFRTVCGVVVNGKSHRYNCKVVDFFEGHHKVKTTLHYPDMTMRLKWKSGNKVSIHMEGMNPQEEWYSVSDGETNFMYSDKTYFYISNQDAASRELGTYAD